MITALAVVSCVPLMQLVAANSAGADAVYHTARIPLLAVGGAPGRGTVVNIHPNGPVVFAHEIYRLRHATRGKYSVALTIYPTSTSCSGTSLTLTTATLVTNGAGNGVAGHKFSPADAAGLHGLTVSAIWAVTGPATYKSRCSVITLD
jgi:hypothetical protein